MTTAVSPRLFDPICGMWLEAERVMATYTYIGHTYSFCCSECRDLFARTPDVHVVRLAHDPEACIAHCCSLQRREIGAPGECTPTLSMARNVE